MYQSQEIATGKHVFKDGWTFVATAHGTLEYVSMKLKFME